MLRGVLLAVAVLVLAQNRGCLEDSVPNGSQEPDSGPQSGEPFTYPGDPTKPRVRMDTSFGTVVVELYPDDSPITVDNFLQYVADEHYDDSIFHRLVQEGFVQVIQGGGYDAGLNRLETEDPIENESNNGLSNLRGTIAMARTTAPDSATDQFYINTTDNAVFDFNFETRAPGYAVFGHVVYGIDVVDLIRQQPTENRGGGFAEIPAETIYILRMRELGPDE